MWGWFNAATLRASRSKRSLKRWWATLMATMRSRRVSRALYTSPMPPAPMGARISYGPRRAPADRDIPGKLYLTGWRERRAFQKPDFTPPTIAALAALCKSVHVDQVSEPFRGWDRRHVPDRAREDDRNRLYRPL